MMDRLVPEVLREGDEIRVIAPSTGLKIIGADSREIAAARFAEMGLKVSFGANTTDDNFDYFGTTELQKRVDDLNAAFCDKNVKAVFTIIGGFNSNQLLPFLDYAAIRANPKVICGFSDITALLNGIYAKTGLVTFLGPHYSSFGMKHGFDYTWEMMRQMLFERGDWLDIRPSAAWSDDLWFIDQEKRDFIKNDGYWKLHDGTAAGTLIGGNLCTQILLLGTSYRPAFAPETILLVEDTSSSDGKNFLRNLQALAYQPDFSHVKGLVIGRFQKDSKIGRKDLQYIVDSIPQLNNIPVLANVDFGHTTPLLTLPIGGRAEITAGGLRVRV